jgi:carbonic anhydrase/acetyltransferase-like protein (isoleucine patch superfamily)
MEREVLGASPTVADSAFVSEMAYLVGDVTIADGASLWPFVCLRADREPTVVGEDTNVQEFSMLHGADVGDRVTVGHNVVIDHARIGDDVLVGMSSTVQLGAEVESNALVAAGSLVTEDTVVPSGHLAYGVPAETRPLTPEQEATIERTAQHYVENRETYKGAGGLEGDRR